jgi:hypothetical protein
MPFTYVLDNTDTEEAIKFPYIWIFYHFFIKFLNSVFHHKVILDYILLNESRNLRNDNSYYSEYIIFLKCSYHLSGLQILYFMTNETLVLFCFFWLCFFLFWQYWGLNSGPYTCLQDNCSTSLCNISVLFFSVFIFSSPFL